MTSTLRKKKKKTTIRMLGCWQQPFFWSGEVRRPISLNSHLTFFILIKMYYKKILTWYLYYCLPLSLFLNNIICFMGMLTIFSLIIMYLIYKNKK